MPNRLKLIAYVSPMLLFVALLGLNSLLKEIGGAPWLSSAEYWIYPVQMILCGGLLLWFRREYDFQQLARPIFTVTAGVVVFLLWISPQAFFGVEARTTGFNPETFSANPSLYWATVVLRFIRLVVVVPLMEEIFWRGFLLRFFVDEDFERVPFGRFSWFPFLAVTLAFCFSHSKADWLAAFLTGAIYNGVAYRTKSLSSCILTHAVTNLLLGLWIMKTKQWGFW
jgi:CAAX prenyl protease-like protein